MFVLATGGIEVPRLLLASDRAGGGFGNLGDCLGRFYMCHFENTCGRIVPHKKPVAFRFERTSDGVYCRRQMRFTPSAQRTHHLLNTVFRLHFPSYADASHGSSVMSAIYMAKSALVPEYRAILQQHPDAACFAAGATHRQISSCATFPGSHDLPAIGYSGCEAGEEEGFPIRWWRMQMAVFHWNSTPSRPRMRRTASRYREVAIATVFHACILLGVSAIKIRRRRCGRFSLLRASLERNGAAQLLFDDELLAGEIARSVPLGHHVGTARMAATANTGVVDVNCAVFGLPNLYVASSAVFPTCSYANPDIDHRGVGDEAGAAPAFASGVVTRFTRSVLAWSAQYRGRCYNCVFLPAGRGLYEPRLLR